MHYIAWVSLGAKLIKYEDLMRAGTDLGSGFSEEFFRGIANFLKFELPGDWPQRVAEAFAPEKSWTFAHIDPGVEKFPEREFFLDLLRAEAGPLLKFLGYDRTS
jgi:hypothetical protein